MGRANPGSLLDPLDRVRSRGALTMISNVLVRRSRLHVEHVWEMVRVNLADRGQTGKLQKARHHGRPIHAR